MISEGTLAKLLEVLDDEDRIPDEDGWYTVSGTTYGSSSLSRGGSYFDKANNLTITKEIEAGTLEGVRERASWPGVCSIVFRPEDMGEEGAQRLALLVEGIGLHASYVGTPCLDEDLAYELEAEDERQAVRAELERLAFDKPELFSLSAFEDEEMTTLRDEAVMAVISACQEQDPCAIVVETGPSVFVDADRLEKVVRSMDRKDR